MAVLFLARAPARAESASEICQPRDDKAETKSVTDYFTQHLRAHLSQSYAKKIGEKAVSNGKLFVEQKINDQRADFCAAQLQLVEDIKAAPSRTTSDCAGPLVVNLMDRYLYKLASGYEENRLAMGRYRDEQLKEIKLKLFEIAKGSTADLDSSYQGQSLKTAPQAVRFEWIKQEATKLATEARTVWGDVDGKNNPLVQKNLLIAREAVRAKAQRDALRARYKTDGKIPASCKIK